ncbi:MAG: transcription-repair coupling factor [Cyanobacteria bacterium P01_F01_bin.33]
MSLLPVVRTLSQSSITADLVSKLEERRQIDLSGLARLPKGLLAAAIAQSSGRSLCVITSTLEEAGRWMAQLEAMGWDAISLYPTSEASPYEPFDAESELIWGQLQVLADLCQQPENVAIVSTERALQPHLPPREVFEAACFQLQPGQTLSLKTFSQTLAELGYERVSLVEREGQWSQRGDIVDIYPVANEWPVRLEWFGDELEKMREFDPATQRSQEAIDQLSITPTSFAALALSALRDRWESLPNTVRQELDATEEPEGLRRFLGLAFDAPASLIDYLPEQTLVAIDELGQCQAHSHQWVVHADEQWQHLLATHPEVTASHRTFADNFETLEHCYRLRLFEFEQDDATLNVASRPVPAIPLQFGQLAQTLRQERQSKRQVWLISAQPSRTVALLQEHDCPAQFVPNPGDFPAIDRLSISHTPVALKYSGLAELEGFVLPPFGQVLVSDREFFGQHALATPSYVRKRRRATSRQVDPDRLKPGNYVVHKSHGIGKFIKLETLSVNRETREYLVIQYEDGILRVAADQLSTLSRFRSTSGKAPALNRMSGKTWEKTKNKVKKAVKKVAFDLLELYAKRAEQRGFAFPVDTPWQQELEDSFPYQPTSDQLKAIQDVKRDMEGERPMDRLICGDVGFGKTEVAIRSMFKAVMSGKQAALLAPTTILAQQHYHTLRERFAPYPIQVGLLNRFRTTKERKDIQARLALGELDVVVGTHQLLGKTVQFKDLGLLAIDEEQRFGVNQKEKIKALKTQVDVLTLTATPIPRTLYMSLSGAREMSLITTPPPSRRAIKTHLSPYDLEKVRAAIRQELDRGGQVFYVVNRVAGIEDVAAKLRLMVPDLKIAIAHGQMQEGELETTMLAFSNGEADLLVCTTIIESGLDIPRVNTILVENAAVFGLAQLYQLRGRVGRSGIQAHAWLFYNERAKLTDDARKRLRAIQEYAQLGSGYQLAMRDMEIRGVGNLLGTAQSGQMNAVGFDLYLEMLNDAIREIRGQAIPTVDDTQIDLNITAMIPQTYITDTDQKMSAYRRVATATSRPELKAIAAEWSERYGPIPKPVAALVQVMELKQIAKSLGFSRIKPAQANVMLETPMEEPAWQRLKENLPSHLQSRFIYQPGKVTVRGLGQSPSQMQLDNLTQWLGKMLPAVNEPLLAVNSTSN